MQSNKSDGGQRGRKAAGRDRFFVADGFMKAVSFRCNSHFRGSSKSVGASGALCSVFWNERNSTPFPPEV